MNLVWTKLALQDIGHVYYFIALDQPQAAKKTIAQIEDAAHILVRYPLMGRKGRVAGTRELVVAHTPYVMVYREKKQQIQILSVIHMSRRWPETV